MTKEINQVLEFIDKVAKKTKLIGLNASIEAARLGNDGKGFTVVSSEIQKLSENTQSTTRQITELNGLINTRIGATVNKSEHTLGIVEDQSAAMEELSATVQDSLALAERLRMLIDAKK